MQHEIEILCRYRLERAEEDLQAARINHSSGLSKASMNLIDLIMRFSIASGSKYN